MRGAYYFVVLSLFLMLVSCGKSEPKSKEPMSVAAMIATIDANSAVAEDSLEVGRARIALAKAAEVCALGEESVGDMAVATKNILVKENISIKVVEVIETLPQMLGQFGQVKTDGCAEALALYAGYRTAKMDHLSATNGVRGLYKIMGAPGKA